MSEHVSPPFGLWASFGVAGGAITLTLGGGLLAAALRELPGEDVRAIAMGAALAAPYVLTLVGVWLLSAARGDSLSDTMGLKRVPIAATLSFGFAVAVAARMFAGLWGIVLQGLGVELPGSDIDPTTLLPSGALGIALTLAIACVLAPVAEELVFRGVLFPAVATRWGVRAGVIVSSALFAAVHVYLFAIPPIFVLAVVLARLYARSGTLWLPIAVHAFFNGIGLAAVYLLKAAGAL